MMTAALLVSMAFALSGCATRTQPRASTVAPTACGVLTRDGVAALTGREIVATKSGAFMDAMQMYTCDYELREGAGRISFSIMDYAQPNPDVEKRLAGPRSRGSGCSAFVTPKGRTISCVGDVAQYGLAVVGQSGIIDATSGAALIRAAAAKLSEPR